MALKSIEVFSEKKDADNIKKVLKDFSVLDFYSEKFNEGVYFSKILVRSENIEAITDVLESYFEDKENFRILILPVEASIPRVNGQENKNNNNCSDRTSREELYAKISENAELSKIYLFLIAVSSLVAGLGLVYENIAVLIGAMVIAPLLGPNIAMAFSVILTDIELALKSAKTIFFGFLIGVIVSIIIGFLMKVDPSSAEISLRTNIGLADLAIALASGSAGVIALTSGRFLTSLMGIMIAVALIPPLVVFGMLIGAGFWTAALSAFLLFSANLICINLAGIVTFIAQGIKPRIWQDSVKAKIVSALTVTILILTLIIIIAVSSVL